MFPCNGTQTKTDSSRRSGSSPAVALGAETGSVSTSRRWLAQETHTTVMHQQVIHMMTVTMVTHMTQEDVVAKVITVTVQ